MDAFRVSIPLLAASIRSIHLKRGDTLKLEHYAGVALDLVFGSAYLSTGHWTYRISEGATIPSTGNGTALIYALEQTSLRVKGSDLCNIELRRRGEVARLII